MYLRILASQTSRDDVIMTRHDVRFWVMSFPEFADVLRYCEKNLLRSQVTDIDLSNEREMSNDDVISTVDRILKEGDQSWWRHHSS